MKHVLVNEVLEDKSEMIKNLLVIYWSTAENCLVGTDYKCHFTSSEAFVSNFFIVNDYLQEKIQGFEYS